LSTIRFGDELELDATAYELRRGGRAVRLERIPMEILLLLVERRDELVTREQIVERVWGKGVHVETDNAINVAMRKIRTALRDDSENPRYIRTVTAKGYRFVAEVVASPQPVLAAPPPSPVRPRSAGWIAATVAVAILAVSGIYLFRSKPAPADAAFAPAERVILAVLPFENLTGDPEQEYFSDGLTEEMIGRLGNLAPDKLAVIARTSVMRYKRDPAPLSKVGDDLHVQYVLEGSVRRDPQRVRITTQLVRVSDQTHVWARQYDRDPADLLRVQDEIADAIAREIRITLAASPSPSPLTPDEYEAYDLYLEGRHAWSERTPDGFRRGIALFERAIEKRPGDARAYAGLADCYALTASWGFAPAAEVIPKAKEAALAAIDAGADVLLADTDQAARGAFSAAEGANVYVVATYADQASLAPKAILGSVLYDYGALMKQMVVNAAAGKLEPGKAYYMGIADGFGGWAPIPAMKDIIPADAQKNFAGVLEDSKARRIKVPELTKPGDADKFDLSSLKK